MTAMPGYAGLYRPAFVFLAELRVTLQMNPYPDVAIWR